MPDAQVHCSDRKDGKTPSATEVNRHTNLSYDDKRSRVTSIAVFDEMSLFLTLKKNEPRCRGDVKSQLFALPTWCRDAITTDRKWKFLESRPFRGHVAIWRRVVFAKSVYWAKARSPLWINKMTRTSDQRHFNQAAKGQRPNLLQLLPRETPQQEARMSLGERESLCKPEPLYTNFLVLPSTLSCLHQDMWTRCTIHRYIFSSQTRVLVSSVLTDSKRRWRVGAVSIQNGGLFPFQSCLHLGVHLGNYGSQTCSEFPSDFSSIRPRSR